MQSFRLTAVMGLGFFAAGFGYGEPFVPGPLFDTPLCDVPGLGHEELGVNPAVPHDFNPLETIRSSAVVTTRRACLDSVRGDGIAGNDWLVTITNLTGRDFIGIAFVTDAGNTVSNRDGIYGVPNPLGQVSDIFTIDYGPRNAPLVFESISVNANFNVGETWQFIVNDFVVTTGPPGAPVFRSVGVGPASFGDGLSNASIILIDPGIPPPPEVPEPASSLLLLGGAAILAAGKVCSLPGRGRHSRQEPH